MNRLLRLQVMDLKGRFLWWCGEAAFDSLFHMGHQDAVAEPLPTLLGVVDRHDRPPTSRRPSNVEYLVLLAGCFSRDVPPRVLPRTAPWYRLGSDVLSRTPFLFSFQIDGAASRGSGVEGQTENLKASILYPTSGCGSLIRPKLFD